MSTQRISQLQFDQVYPLYVKKVERKGRVKAEVDQIITWLTGYSELDIGRLSKSHITFETFFNQSPNWQPNARFIKGVICGIRVEDIEDPIVQKIRYLDKLIGELAKGKAMDKILRQG